MSCEGELGGKAPPAGADGGQMGRVCRSSFVVHRESLWMPDAHASAFERVKAQRPGRAPTVAPTPFGISSPNKNPRKRNCRRPLLLGPLYPTSDPNAVGACRRPALPGLRVYKFKNHVGVRVTTENQRNGIVEICSVVFKTVDQTFDPNAVGACRRPALPGRRFLYVPRNRPAFPPAARD